MFSVVVAIGLGSFLISISDCNQETFTTGKIDMMREKTVKGIPFFSIAEYMELVIVADDTYDIITLYSLKNIGGRCDPCEKAHTSLKILSKALKVQPRPIFVIGIDIEAEKDLINVLKIKSVPTIHLKSQMRKIEEFFPSNQLAEIHALQKWIKDKTNIDIKIKTPADYNKIVGLFVAVLFVAIISYLMYNYLLSYFTRNAVALVSVGTCILFPSGFMYTSINNSPFMHRNSQNGQLESLMDNSQNQTGAEVWIIGGLCKINLLNIEISFQIKFNQIKFQIR